MKINIRGDKVAVTEAIHDYIVEKLGKLDKYFETPEELTATVLIKVRKTGQEVEVTIPAKKYILRAEEEQEDVYAAIDVAVDKLERQIRKNKTRIESSYRKTRDTHEVDLSFVNIEETEENKDSIVKRKVIDIKPMSEEEAIIQMELLGHAFYLFKDAENMKVKLVYKRKESGYGIIETE